MGATEANSLTPSTTCKSLYTSAKMYKDTQTLNHCNPQHTHLDTFLSTHSLTPSCHATLHRFTDLEPLQYTHTHTLLPCHTTPLHWPCIRSRTTRCPHRQEGQRPLSTAGGTHVDTGHSTARLRHHDTPNSTNHSWRHPGKRRDTGNEALGRSMQPAWVS